MAFALYGQRVLNMAVQKRLQNLTSIAIFVHGVSKWLQMLNRQRQFAARKYQQVYLKYQMFKREAQFQYGEHAFGLTKTYAGRYFACFVLHCDFSKSSKTHSNFYLK